jgi:hypothetical protein
VETSHPGCSGVSFHARACKAGTLGRLPALLCNPYTFDTVPHNYIEVPADVVRRRVSPGALIYERQASARSVDGWGRNSAEETVSDIAMSADTDSTK